MSRIKYWVWFSQLYGLNTKNKCFLLDHFGSPENVFFADRCDYDELGFLSEREKELLGNKELGATMQIMDKCAQTGVDILCIGDTSYPERLANIYDPPCVLYIKGKLPWMDEEAAIAIAGTRKATPYGIKMGRLMGYEVCRYGGMVVSCLSKGVDSAAVQGVLRADGVCVGVLATAIDEAYPAFNKHLFEDVAVRGALVSEYPPGAPVNKSNFRSRNRILSGLSAGVVIIEAPEGSGSLLVADLAGEQGRDVFAVPGNADAVNCKGSNRLILEGARPVVSGWDVMSEYVMRYPDKVKYTDRMPKAEYPEEPEKTQEREEKNEPEIYKFRIPRAQKEIDKKKHIEYIDGEKRPEGLTSQQLKIVGAMDAPGMYVDEIIEKSGLNASAVLAELTVLQIMGVVYQEAGKRFTLHVKSTK